MFSLFALMFAAYITARLVAVIAENERGAKSKAVAVAAALAILIAIGCFVGVEMKSGEVVQALQSAAKSAGEL